MDNKLAYDRGLITRKENLSLEHKKVLQWTGTQKRVLEVACHTGYTSYWLQKQDCEVTGVEIYEPALEKAKPFLKRAVSGDIESKEVWGSIAGEKFDVILFMHILEHLVNPEVVLKKSKDILLPGGRVIIALPNINNWVERWKIFRGHFEYTETGVMDRTHLRFYNYHTAVEMIQNCNFKIEEYFGDSCKVQFGLLPRIGIINRIYSRLICKLASPNFTDKITMFKIISN